MIWVAEVEVAGVSEAGKFRGHLDFSGGLQIIIAPNSYGKSLAANSIAWCLGLEVMFGLQRDDQSFFPEAVREEVTFPGQPPSRVVASAASIRLAQSDGRKLKLSRDIVGQRNIVSVEEAAADGKVRVSRLSTTGASMQDDRGGLQNFLFQWFGWPRAQVATFKGKVVDVYLENLAPLFFVEQQDGWTDIQSRQIGRYQQQQIAQVAVEYLLGALGAVENRKDEQVALQRDLELRSRARDIADLISEFLTRNGWQVSWSGAGTLEATVERWKKRGLREALRSDAGVDLAKEIAAGRERSTKLRKRLTRDPVDPQNASAQAAVSQRAIELKGKRHELSVELSTTRVQHEEAEALLESLEHRIQAAVDVVRLKKTGVGRIDQIECPTCHRVIDPAEFSLSNQPVMLVEAHVVALKHDRDLVKSNIDELAKHIIAVRTEYERAGEELRAAEIALATVTSAVGAVREQLGMLAASLSDSEREVQRLTDSSRELDRLQVLVDAWTQEVVSVTRGAVDDSDLRRRVGAFTHALREYLLALGHSAVTPQNVSAVRLDEQYVPLRGEKRLRALGSASDVCRLIAAYSLALAAASLECGGLHPGFVVLDEPLQQNPDDSHRDQFASFLGKTGTLRSGFQTIIFTYLREVEVLRLREEGLAVRTLAGEHFLELETDGEQPPTAEASAPPGGEREALEGTPAAADANPKAAPTDDDPGDDGGSIPSSKGHAST